ncbi:MAG: NAD(P)/FAD-dependent oxidoreductase [Variibacter sp.]
MSIFAADSAESARRPSEAAVGRGRLRDDIDVDVCVIGAGIAGLTAALTLAQLGRSVAVVEAERLADGASANNSGVALPGYAESLDRIVQRVGLPSAKALWSLSLEGLQTIRDNLSQDSARPAGHLMVERRNDAAKLRARADWLRETFDADVAFRSAEEVRALLPSAAYYQAIFVPAALNIVPALYLRDLAAAAERAGVRIFEETQAFGIDAAGLRKHVDTGAARVRAGHIVVTAGAKLGGLMPRIARASLMLEVGLIETAALPEQARNAFRFRGSVGETGACHQLVDDALVWSGGATTRNTNTQALARRLRADVGQTYPLLRSVEINRAASAPVAATVHRMPQIGELSPGVWLGSGFGRRGLATAAMGGLLIARGIAVGDDRWRLFEPFGLVSSGGRAGRVLAEAALKARRAATQLQNFIARYRSPVAPAPVEAADVAVVEAPIDVAPIVPDDQTAQAPVVAPVQDEITALPMIHPVSAEESASAAPKRKKKAAAPRRRAPRKPKLPAPADVITLERKSASKRAVAKTETRRRRASSPPTELEAAPEIVAPSVPPGERLH